MEAMATGSKRLTKCMVRESASSTSEELPPGCPNEVLEGISTAAHFTTFTEHRSQSTVKHRDFPAPIGRDTKNVSLRIHELHLQVAYKFRA